MNKLFKLKITWAVIIALFISIIMALLIFFNIGQAWHLRLTDLLYTKNNPSPAITIVGIDSKSISDSQGLGRWQSWRRTYYAEVIKKIAENKPKVIGVDVLFANSSSGIGQEDLQTLIKNNQVSSENLKAYNQPKIHPDDQKLAEAIKNAGNVILNEYVGTYRNYLEEDNVWEAIGKSESSLPIFRKNAKGIANVRMINDSDEIVRQIPIGFKIAGNFIESFSILIAKNYLDLPKTKPQVKDNNYMIGDIKIPVQKGQMYINYFGPPGSYQEISFADVYHGKINSNDFKDKIVLIGATASLLQDRQFTPASLSMPMPGIEIHANAIQTILDKKFIQDQGITSKLVLVTIFAFILAIIFSYLNIFGAIAILFTSTGIYTFVAINAFRNGLILNMIYPYLTILLTYISVLIYRYFTETKAKLFLKNAFEHYLNPEVVKQIIKKPDMVKLGGEKREITILFSDLKNFSTLSEKQTPEETVQMLDEYFNAMTEVILLNGGTLDKYEGDAIMAFFGAPLPNKDHAVLACQTALMSLKVLEKLNKIWKNKGKPELTCRIGINTGEVVVGNIGAKKHFNYTAIGDAVNIASRLEQSNKEFGTNILVSQSTYKQAKDKFTFKDLGEIQVKGKEQKVKIYELNK